MVTCQSIEKRAYRAAIQVIATQDHDEEDYIDGPREITYVGAVNTEPTAIVLGLFETGLAVARSLGRRGIRVVGLDTRRDWTSTSRYMKTRVCPHPTKDEAAFIQFLVDHFGAHSPPAVLFIASDPFLTAISNRREELAHRFQFLLPERALVDAISDKHRQAQLAQKITTPVPATFVLDHAGTSTGLEKNLEFPLIVKARCTNEWRPVFGGKVKGFVASTPEELSAILQRLKRRRIRSVVQEIIPGPATCHYKICVYITSRGEVLQQLTLQKQRQHPPQFGIGSCVRSVHDPALERVGIGFFRGIGYRGVGSAEFKRDPRDGLFKLIELNPRFWQQTSLAAACGTDLALAQYLDLTGQPAAPSRDFRDGVEWVTPWDNFQSVWALRRKGEARLRDAFSAFRRGTVWADLAWDDPLPFVSRLCSALTRRRGQSPGLSSPAYGAARPGAQRPSPGGR